jgi:hypothetical protein
MVCLTGSKIDLKTPLRAPDSNSQLQVEAKPDMLGSAIALIPTLTFFNFPILFFLLISSAAFMPGKWKGNFIVPTDWNYEQRYLYSLGRLDLFQKGNGRIVDIQYLPFPKPSVLSIG